VTDTVEQPARQYAEGLMDVVERGWLIGQLREYATSVIRDGIAPHEGILDRADQHDLTPTQMNLLRDLVHESTETLDHTVRLLENRHRLEAQ
jgi:hypothetical protein